MQLCGEIGKHVVLRIQTLQVRVLSKADILKLWVVVRVVYWANFENLCTFSAVGSNPTLSDEIKEYSNLAKKRSIFNIKQKTW